MTIHTNVGGVWKDVNAPQVKIGSVWKTVETVQVNVGGVWKTAFEAGGSVNQPNITVSQTAALQRVRCGIRFQQDGGSDLIDKDNITVPRVSGEWWSAEPEALIGDDYDVRQVSLIQGTWDFQAAAVGTWINIGTGVNWWVERTIGKEQEGPGTDNAKGNFAIRDASTLVVKATFTLEATATQTL